MNHALLHSVAFVLLTSALFGYDADTIALYDFKSAETNAVGEGTLITNLVDATRFLGTNTMGGYSTDLTKYSADRPGKYIFERAVCGSVPAIVDPQSIRFEMTEGYGGDHFKTCLTFADLGTAISSNDNWTLEFFYKFDSENKWAGTESVWQQMLKMNCGLLYNPSTTVASEQALAGTAQPFDIRVPVTSFYTCVRSASYHSVNISASYKRVGTKSHFDDLWHHYACVYSASDKKFTIYLDHSETWSWNCRSTTNSVLSAREPLVLGRNAIKGNVSCLRVSKCARTPGSFLHASDDPAFVPEKVFHWRLDGANGETVSTVTNICHQTYPFEGQYIGEFTNHADGVVAGGGTAPKPAYTNDIPNVKKPYLRNGRERLGRDAGGVFDDIKQRESEAYFLPGTGLRLSAYDHYPVEAGSWTVEFFAKFDRDGWLARTAGTAYPRFTIFCHTYSSGGYSDMTLSVSGSACETMWFSVDKQPSTTTVQNEGWNARNLLADRQWHHYAIVYDEEALKMRVYVDKVLRMTTTLSAPYVPCCEPYQGHASQNYYFGYGGNNHPFMGSFDEIRMVRRALKPEEFLQWRRTDAGVMVFLR